MNQITKILEHTHEPRFKRCEFYSHFLHFAHILFSLHAWFLTTTINIVASTFSYLNPFIFPFFFLSEVITILTFQEIVHVQLSICILDIPISNLLYLFQCFKFLLNFLIDINIFNMPFYSILCF